MVRDVVAKQVETYAPSCFSAFEKKLVGSDGDGSSGLCGNDIQVCVRLSAKRRLLLYCGLWMDYWPFLCHLRTDVERSNAGRIT